MTEPTGSTGAVGSMESSGSSGSTGSTGSTGGRTTARGGRRRALPRVVTPSITLTRPRLPRLSRLPGLLGPGRSVDDLPEGSRLREVLEATRRVWSPVLTVARWVSPLGWTLVGVGLLAWAVGAGLRWTEWLMIAAGALCLVAACLVLALGTVRVDVHSEITPSRVTVGEPATGRLVVRNTGRRRTLPLVVELPVGRSVARFTLPVLGPDATHEEVFVIPTARRGVIPVGPASTVQGDPLGIVRRTLRWSDAAELYVHPRTVPVEPIGAGLLRDLEGETTADLSMSDLAFHALRDYAPGDDRRYIHWRSSAKAGRLLVRQFLDTRRSHLAVVVDADPQSYRGGEEDVETAFAVAASLVRRCALDEQDVTVVSRGQRASRTTGPLTLDTLARVEPGPVGLEPLCTEVADLASDISVAFVVTGGRRPFSDVQRAAAQFEHEVRKVVLTVDARERVGVQNIGPMTMLSLSALEDLRPLLVGGLQG